MATAPDPPFALERLEATGVDRLVYHLPKPGPDGRTDLTLTPLELIDRLAALIPPPRLHRRRYYNGVLAPNAPLRAAVTALARALVSTPEQPAVSEPEGGEGHYRSPARYLWAMLIARIYELFPLVCGHFGAEMRIVAFITDTVSVTHSLRFAIRLRWAVQGTPSLARPLDGAKVHRTFAFRPSRPRAHRQAHQSACALTRAPLRYAILLRLRTGPGLPWLGRSLLGRSSPARLGNI